MNSILSTWLTHQRLRLKRHLIRLLRLNVRREKIFGLTVHFFNYRVFTSLFRQMFITKEYFFRARISRPFIIDCGSNIGMSMLFFKRLYPQSEILCFEPDPQTFAVLEKNVRGNSLKNVEIFNKALSDAEGSVDFYSNPENPGALTMSIYSTWNPEKITYQVHTVKLSRYIFKTVDFLKMDIEGAEDMVIEDLAQQGKLQLIREMVMEYHHHMVPGTNRLGKMLGILEEHGFGYQIQTALKVPFKRDQYQNLLIYAYQKIRQGDNGDNNER